jgi:hypothetical protein
MGQQENLSYNNNNNDNNNNNNNNNGKGATFAFSLPACKNDDSLEFLVLYDNDD